MAKTVNEAFNEFLRESINLNYDETQLARNSRNWLLTQIHSFPSKKLAFPRLFPKKDIFFWFFC
jgi:hypothetical protein